jgi:hypothetical protein
MGSAVEARDYYLQRARDTQALAAKVDGDGKALYSRLAKQWTMMAETADVLPGSLGALRAREKQQANPSESSESGDRLNIAGGFAPRQGATLNPPSYF